MRGRILMHEHLGTGGTPPGGRPERPADDAEWMTAELKATAREGVTCIVAAQQRVAGPEVTAYLRELSTRSGIQLIATGSLFSEPSYPAAVKTKSEQQLADELIAAAAVGRYGAFGEIGIAPDHAELSADERKVYRAVARAHLRTGIPIFTHANYSMGANVPMDIALRQLDVFEAAGVKAQHLAIGHVCCANDPQAAVARRIAQRGAFVAFDRVTRQQQWVTDAQRLTMVRALLDAGYIDQLLISSDYSGAIVTSVGENELRPGPFLAHDGGPGWARSLTWFLPMMQQAGMTDDVIRRVAEDNPRRFLSFVPSK
jgi:phosphotriesterase-related protein